MSFSGNDVISKSIEVLRKYPLCSRCLGRLFAKYGLGLSNITRGKSIKTLVLMELHRLVINDIKNLSLLKEVSNNIGFMPQLVSRFSGITSSKTTCYICSNTIEDKILKLLDDVISELSKFKVRTFIISIRKGSEIERRELELVSEFNLDAWESIRRELKRELGKKVKSLLNIEPDFKYPDALVLIDLDTLSVKVTTTPTYILCRYVKLGRNISQLRWISGDGVRKHQLSIEDVVEPIAKLLSTEGLEIHTAGREDINVRVLGSGRPMIIEFRNVRDKTVGIDEVARNVSSNDFIRVSFDKYVEPKHLREFRSKKQLKIYRLLILSKSTINGDVLEKLEKEFSNRIVRQRTPTRILRKRKRDTILNRKVYDIKVRKVNDYILEILLKCDGGLYIKELVHGDCGRTSPSIVEVLNSELTILEIDLMDISPTES